MEFAVIATGGKQYVVSEGDVISVEKLEGELEEGSSVIFDKVLLIDNGKDTVVGDPFVNGVKVKGTVTEDGRAKKINVIKFRSKSRYFKKRGHRQPFNKIKINSIK